MADEGIVIVGGGGCTSLIAFIYYLVISSIAVHNGLRATSKDFGQLGLDCVIGEQFYFTFPYNESAKPVPAAIRARDDGGLLQARAIVLREKLSVTAQELIDSQSITLGEWASRVSNGIVRLNGSDAAFPVWVYPVLPVQGAAEGQAWNGTTIAVSKRVAFEGMPLAANATAEADAWNETRLDGAGFDYCDGAGGRAGDNPWAETKSWLPYSVLRLGQSGLVLTLMTPCFFCIAIALADTAHGKLTWAVVLVPAIAFYAVGGIGAQLFHEGGQDGWELGIAKNSPQTSRSYGIANSSFITYIIFAVLAVVIFVLGWLALTYMFVSDARDRRRERERQANYDGVEPDPKDQGGEVLNPVPEYDSKTGDSPKDRKGGEVLNVVPAEDSKAFDSLA